MTSRRAGWRGVVRWGLILWWVPVVVLWVRWGREPAPRPPDPSSCELGELCAWLRHKGLKFNGQHGASGGLTTAMDGWAPPYFLLVDSRRWRDGPRFSSLAAEEELAKG